MHLNKICHRDIKPENFLFLTKDKDSVLKAIDFGFSRAFGETDDNGINKKVEEESNKKVSRSNKKSRRGKGEIMNTKFGTVNFNKIF